MKPSFRLPFPPRTRGTGRIEHLGTSCQLSAVSSQPNQKPDTKTNSVIPSEGAFQPKRGITVSSGPRTQQLPLRELEALASALLAILLALFAARIAADHTLGLQLLPQFGVELHQGPGNAQLHRVGLAAHSATQHAGNDVEGRHRIGRSQWRFRRRTLRRSHEILFKGTSVHAELAAARTQINAGDRPLAASRSVVLNQFCHLAISS